MIIKIAKEYTKTPGGRYISEGKYSGEDFRKRILEPKYLEAKNNNDVLTVDLDGGYGYAPSFLDEAFGGLARELKDHNILSIKIISDEEPGLVDKVRKYIEESL